ncbi:hypothetical protein BDV39DRAFT_193878 [Aspergillus sergii]|uniref:4'-phosphopantetheinyl transferase domain-containing protein n=1 Tax=Aspergillus sergii TaxID=1034303 RepID=A0A5N6X3J5_9EURO|nr:hypothetical protein BDV39DRAFT_193878 [Aspergillus sergii]
MVVYYQLAGKQVGSHVLAMGVLGSLFGGVYLATRGGSQPKQAAPPIQASSKDEETFIQKIVSTLSILSHDFRTRFALPAATNPPNQRPLPSATEMARWLAGRFAAKEAARKAAPNGAASLGWKDVMVRVSETDRGRPEVVYLDGETARIGKLSISHDGDYVVATVLAAG